MPVVLGHPDTDDPATPLGGMEERLRSLREWVIERSTIETADRVMPGSVMNCVYLARPMRVSDLVEL